MKGLMIVVRLFFSASRCLNRIKGIRSKLIVPDSALSVSPNAPPGTRVRTSATKGWFPRLPCWVAVDVGKYFLLI